MTTSIIRTVKVADIVEDERLRVRDQVNGDAVADFCAAHERGETFPRVVCFEIDERLLLVSGSHRLGMYRRQGVEEIEIEIHMGTIFDALLFAATANRKNGVRMTRADTRKAIRLILMEKEGVGMADAAIARIVGCSDKTVGSVRSDLEAGSEIPKVNERRGADGKTYSVRPKYRHSIPLHPAAKIFPMVVGKKYELIKRLIAKHGLIDPIALYDGQILDGKIRYKICMELGIEPQFKEIPIAKNPFDYVWSMNGCRKSLSPEEERTLHSTKLALSDEAKIKLEPWEMEPYDEPDELDWDVDAHFA